MTSLKTAGWEARVQVCCVVACSRLSVVGDERKHPVPRLSPPLFFSPARFRSSPTTESLEQASCVEKGEEAVAMDQ